eukprot:gnl/Dysnectes_brevis/2785_a3394_1853.p1 GENE.gnl/Dysnectes_brevis/2785_a3394_1853~~gnl/Dysnectes_brevis/2785_a3394_1853.p1  ORF type:complete len:208 (+),score=3.58 gnl/Dysnectes_brevis/2785_a3394_1853:115-738(+)
MPADFLNVASSLAFDPQINSLRQQFSSVPQTGKNVQNGILPYFANTTTTTVVQRLILLICPFLKKRWSSVPPPDLYLPLMGVFLYLSSYAIKIALFKEGDVPFTPTVYGSALTRVCLVCIPQILIKFLGFVPLPLLRVASLPLYTLIPASILLLLSFMPSPVIIIVGIYLGGAAGFHLYKELDHNAQDLGRTIWAILQPVSLLLLSL